MLDESAKWDEGGTYRIAMHSVMGGLLGGVGGAAGAGVAAASAPELNKLQASLTDSLKATGMPDSAAQVAGSLISAGTAAGMGGALGGMAGAAGGFDVDTNNRQLHQSELDKAKRYGKQFQDFIKRTTGENITEAEAIGRMVRQMERWADYETAKQDGFKVDQQVTSFLGMNSVKVSEADYYNPNINKNIANANQGLISLGQSQSSTGLTPEQMREQNLAYERLGKGSIAITSCAFLGPQACKAAAMSLGITTGMAFVMNKPLTNFDVIGGAYFGVLGSQYKNAISAWQAAGGGVVSPVISAENILLQSNRAGVMFGGKALVSQPVNTWIPAANTPFDPVFDPKGGRWGWGGDVNK
ncbi:MAG: hypothetical protein JO080_11805 [Mucilaginibacter sp.]|nr:hypothetical protein [Mucilaginibacter sp.]